MINTDSIKYLFIKHTFKINPFIKDKNKLSEK